MDERDNWLVEDVEWTFDRAARERDASEPPEPRDLRPRHFDHGSLCNQPGCRVDRDGWSECGEIACPACGAGDALTIETRADVEHFACAECSTEGTL
jgi:hypothetical protein